MDRRAFIGTLGLSFALPGLECFGTTNTNIKRLGVVYVPNGINMHHWTPKHYGDIMNMPDSLSPMQDHMDYTSIISGLTHDKARANGDGAGDHARAASTFLTGIQAHKHESKIRSGKSVDQYLADKYNGLTRFDSLQFSGDKSRLIGKCDSGYSCAYQYNLSWKSANQPLAAMYNPRDIFNRLFNVTKLEQKVKLRKKSILDFVLEESKSLAKIASDADKVKLEEYMYSVREVELELERRDKFNLTNNFELNFDIESKSDKFRIMYNLMHLAFLTDTSRVITFLTAHDGYNGPFKEIGIREGHHSLSHHQKDPKKLAALAKIDLFNVRLFSEFISKMKKDNLLENTDIIYGAGISDGNRHNHDELPFMLVGNKQNGKHFRVKKEKPMCDLFVSILHKHNIDMKHFGDSTGELNIV
tara:strand:+ start:3867 stop:5111 length:1245 start_codon:yes stop_codon:yes gene_type:complete